jgi:hypothetical protein
MALLMLRALSVVWKVHIARAGSVVIEHCTNTINVGCILQALAVFVSIYSVFHKIPNAISAVCS